MRVIVSPPVHAPDAPSSVRVRMAPEVMLSDPVLAVRSPEMPNAADLSISWAKVALARRARFPVAMLSMLLPGAMCRQLGW